MDHYETLDNARRALSLTRAPRRTNGNTPACSRCGSQVAGHERYGRACGRRADEIHRGAVAIRGAGSLTHDGWDDGVAREERAHTERLVEIDAEDGEVRS